MSYRRGYYEALEQKIVDYAREHNLTYLQAEEMRAFAINAQGYAYLFRPEAQDPRRRKTGMSYDIRLLDPSDRSQIASVPKHCEGGTYMVGGTNSASLNVTYNYCRHFNFRDLDGLTGEQSIPTLREAVRSLGFERDPDYWAPTPGNTGYACSILLNWATLYPNFVWSVE